MQISIYFRCTKRIQNKKHTALQINSAFWLLIRLSGLAHLILLCGNWRKLSMDTRHTHVIISRITHWGNYKITNILKTTFQMHLVKRNLCNLINISHEVDTFSFSFLHTFIQHIFPYLFQNFLKHPCIKIEDLGSRLKLNRVLTKHKNLSNNCQK